MQGIRFSLSLLAATAGLSQGLVIPDDGGLSAALPSPNGAAGKTLDRREDKRTTGGAINGTWSDTLFTYGLSTCVGMTASGVPNIPGRNVITREHIADWQGNVTAQNWPNIAIAVSVLNPDLLDPSLQDAQKELNRVAMLAATDVSVLGLWAVQVVERQTQQGGDPLGTMRMSLDGRTYAEGAEVIWNRPPTLEVNCWWPVKYTPSNAPASTVADMEALAARICASAWGCYDNLGLPTCNRDSARPLGCT
ncbi:hypothetical protein PG990_006866 [Apiospora arundinis]